MLQEAVSSAPEGAEIGPVAAVFLGIIEGLTEFLPVSSTGHLIVATAALGTPDPSFEIGIQTGAITAILWLYRKDVWSSLQALMGKENADGARVNLLWLILVAALPAAVVGLAFEDPIEDLLFSPLTVAIALIVGGVLLWVMETWQRGRTRRGIHSDREIQGMGLRDAFWIGVMQCLALIPGTSRSGATIAGGVLLGYSRGAAAEFSFLVGLPILYGAGLLKLGGDLLENPDGFTGPRLLALGIGTAMSFLAALMVVTPFVRFVRRHTFVPFAIYRIAAGALLLLAINRGWLQGT